MSIVWPNIYQNLNVRVITLMSWYRWLNNRNSVAVVNEGREQARTSTDRQRQNEEIESLSACDVIDPDNVSWLVIFDGTVIYA